MTMIIFLNHGSVRSETRFCSALSSSCLGLLLSAVKRSLTSTAVLVLMHGLETAHLDYGSTLVAHLAEQHASRASLGKPPRIATSPTTCWRSLTGFLSASALSIGKLSWFGHVTRATSQLICCLDFESRPTAGKKRSDLSFPSLQSVFWTYWSQKCF